MPANPESPTPRCKSPVVRSLAIVAALVVILLAWLIVHPPADGIEWKTQRFGLRLELASTWTSIPQVTSIFSVTETGGAPFYEKYWDLRIGNLDARFSKSLDDPASEEFLPFPIGVPLSPPASPATPTPAPAPAPKENP